MKASIKIAFGFSLGIASAMLSTTMLSIVMFSLAASAQTPGPGAKTAMPAELCPLNNHDDLFLNCPGKRVTMTGRRTTDADPSNYQDISGVGGYTHSATMETSLGQVGAISRKPIKCRKTMTIDGVLRVNRTKRDNGITTMIAYIQASAVRCK